MRILTLCGSLFSILALNAACGGPVAPPAPETDADTDTDADADADADTDTDSDTDTDTDTDTDSGFIFDSGGIDTAVTQLPCVAPDGDLGSAVGASVQTGDTCGAVNEFANTCGSDDGEDLAYSWTAPSAGSYTFDTEGSGYDTALELRTSCAAGNSVLACNDDSIGLQSSITRTMTAGESIVIVVDAYSDFDCGAFILNITGP